VQPTTGILEITVSTLGDSPDPDGYAVAIDGAQGRGIASSDTLTESDIGPGDHRVELGGLTPNCEVAGPNPVVVTVIVGERIGVRFDVTCPAVETATLNVGVVTSGSPPDPDGYLVFVDADRSQSIASTGSLDFSGLLFGSHAVRLGGVAPDCNVQGENPRTIEVSPVGETTTFEVVCWPPPTGIIAYRGEQPGDPPDDPSTFQFDILVRNADGTGLRNLTRTPGANEWLPTWSPDGSHIAFERTDSAEGLVVSRPDGSDPHVVASGGGPLWSPDGRKVLFRVSEGLAVVDVNGSGFRTVATGDIEGYAWSPDGQEIAFDRRSFDSQLVGSVYMINSDGSRPINLTGDEEGADHLVYGWSHNGEWIAFVRRRGFASDSSDIYLARADGSAPPFNLTQLPGRYESVAWSPTSSTLAFTRSLVPGSSESFNTLDVYTMNAEGADLRNLTRQPDTYRKISWSPDGTKLVFDRLGRGETPGGLFIMNADGSGVRGLATDDKIAVEPSWRP
jgi:Tol biopolymer transport system component